jgi:hypothetical protein
MKIRSIRAEPKHAERRMDVQQLAAFCNFTNTPKMYEVVESEVL